MKLDPEQEAENRALKQFVDQTLCLAQVERVICFEILSYWTSQSYACPKQPWPWRCEVLTGTVMCSSWCSPDPLSEMGTGDPQPTMGDYCLSAERHRDNQPK